MSHFRKHLAGSSSKEKDEAKTSLEETLATPAQPAHFRSSPVGLGKYFKENRSTYFEILSSNELYKPLCLYLANEGDKNTASWNVGLPSTTRKRFVITFNPRETEQEEQERLKKALMKLNLGLGVFELTWNTSVIKAIHQVIGDPVATRSGPSLYTSLVLFIDAPQKEQELKDFCQQVWEQWHKAEEKQYTIYTWVPRRRNWQMMATKTIRPVESVILPQKLKKLVIDDLTEFSRRDTARWYVEHGVPYKRSVLFYGPPGTGKSSLITSLAGLMNRSVCFLQPSHPEITDDNLQQAIQRAPANSLIVMEDVDALFDAKRKSEVKSSPLTFSGLLNALDGVCNPEGQIFIMTTNHIERLDPALIRAGRVDLKVPFPSATAKQAEGLFLHFYPGQEELAKQFATVMFERFASSRQDGVTEKVGATLLEGWTDSHRLKVSMASLQLHFISCRTLSPSEAVARARTDFGPDIQEDESSK